ncbi:MAG: DNA/RNA non-specific endonuclease [Bacteroidota bacterium]|nr:DNA/RNA non-specific endonuclease [Bacteroidota bacterium]
MSKTHIIFRLGVSMILIAFFISTGYSQHIEDSIEEVESELQAIRAKQDSLYTVLENLRLSYIVDEIKKAGYPAGCDNEEMAIHPGLVISYNEKHEMANWVAHMVLPLIETGNLSRTNDFRPDTSISTGSAVEEDYFLKYLQPDSTYEYDGYGYDRGHLAPSADYRWSKSGMSATYIYSNISPQRPDFNRGGWGKLENFIRDYVINNNQAVLVYTGPVLSDDLPKVERSVNNVSLPEYFYKIAWDKKNQNIIAFIMPNERLTKPLENYAVSVDSVEMITGLDFFPAWDETLQSETESNVNPEVWFSGSAENDKMPLTKAELPNNAFNTINARAFMGSNKEATVCGTVVSTHKSGKGNTFINLDKSFPDQIFTVTVWDKYQHNFPYEPHLFLMNKKICVTGKVQEFGGKPAIYLENENNLKILD